MKVTGLRTLWGSYIWAETTDEKEIATEGSSTADFKIAMSQITFKVNYVLWKSTKWEGVLNDSKDRLKMS